MRCPVVLLGLILTLPAAIEAQHPIARPNDHRTPAGRMIGDTLVLRLTVGRAAWHIHTEKDPAFDVLAFREEGKAPMIPGPMVRVREGTPIRVVVRNPLSDSLIIHGLGTRGDGVPDSLMVPPRSTTTARFDAGRAGSYIYWAVTTATPRRSLLARAEAETQLAGAVIVDPPGRVLRDRVFLITELDTRGPDGRLILDEHGLPLRDFVAVNGKSWPHTERFTHRVGDSIRWRVLSASVAPHPMHLHGFYFRIDAHGDDTADADTLYAPEERRMAVTEVIQRGQTISMVWSPDRLGGWIFHCHLTSHAVRHPPIDRPDILAFPTTHDHGNPDTHALTGMNGLVIGTRVTGQATRAPAWRPARSLRLFVQSDSVPGSAARRFGYVVQRGAAEPAKDSLESPGPVLVLTRGEATSIHVVNRSPEPTAVHWHGIELESYFDGVVGFGGMPNRTTPAIRPGATFEVRITPRRAGTFMYHTHFDELRQQYGGLVGALLVLEPGERWDPERDRVFVISDGVARRVFINGSLDPPPVDLRAGTTYRLRFANASVDRPILRVRLVRDSTLLAWHPVSKDGWTLGGTQATERPSVTRVGSGETGDFEITPDRAGDVRVEFVLGNGAIAGTVLLRVRGENP